MTRLEPRHPEIIYRPDLQPRGQKTLFGAITMGAWAVWVYLFLPLLSLLAWAMGFDIFGRYMLQAEGPGYLITLTGYAVVVAIAALIILGWSRYQYWRFAGRDRRQSSSRVTDSMTCERFHISPADLKRIHDSRVVVLYLDEQGWVEKAECRVNAEGGANSAGLKDKPGTAQSAD